MAHDHWLTDPENVLPLVRKCLGEITLDAASNRVAQEYVGAKNWYGLDIDKDALALPWYGKVFLNPPYSKGNIDNFVDKAIAEWDRVFADGHGAQSYTAQYPVQRMLILVNTASDTSWYHKLLNTCTSALLWKGRIKFWRIDGDKAYKVWKDKNGKLTNSPRYLNTFFYFDRGHNTHPFYDSFDGKGTFIRLG